ncbi:hypothetical protein BDR22DRAFT_820993 [Usnea florida]
MLLDPSQDESGSTATGYHDSREYKHSWSPLQDPMGLGYGIVNYNWHVLSELATGATARQISLLRNGAFELSRCIDGKSLGELWRLNAISKHTRLGYGNDTTEIDIHGAYGLGGGTTHPGGAISALSRGPPTTTNLLLLSVLHPSPHCAPPIQHVVCICLKELRK